MSTLVLGLWLAACSDRDARLASALTGGDVERGERTFRRLGCGSCHHVDGNRTAAGHVGPALDHFALQAYLPGGAVNTPRDLVRWIRAPREV